MRYFIQFDSDGKPIAGFRLYVDGESVVINRPALRKDGKFMPLQTLSDPDGDYCRMKVGESVRFSGMTTLKRVE